MKTKSAISKKQVKARSPPPPSALSERKKGAGRKPKPNNFLYPDEVEAPAKKAPAKKAPAKKAPPKKTIAKKAPAKKAPPAKKAAPAKKDTSVKDALKKVVTILNEAIKAL